MKWDSHQQEMVPHFALLFFQSRIIGMCLHSLGLPIWKMCMQPFRPSYLGKCVCILQAFLSSVWHKFFRSFSLGKYVWCSCSGLPIQENVCSLQGLPIQENVSAVFKPSYIGKCVCSLYQFYYRPFTIVLLQAFLSRKMSLQSFRPSYQYQENNICSLQLFLPRKMDILLSQV